MTPPRSSRAGFGRVLAVVVALAAGGVASATPQESSDRPDLLRLAEAAQADYDVGTERARTDPSASQEAFRRSIEGWERLRAAGVQNGVVEFNLGNAYLQSGDLGNAIARYLRAQQLLPGDADVMANLAQARARVSTSFATSGTLLLVDSVARTWQLVPAGARTWIAAATWVALWLLLAWRWAAARPGSAGAASAARAATWVLAALATLAGASVIADRAFLEANDVAVLSADGVVLRKGNGEGFGAAFAEPLGPGVECRVLERRPGWLRLELPDGRGGWVREDQVAVP